MRVPLEETYIRTVCSICKNKTNCNKELQGRIDGTLKCDNYETTFIPKKVDKIAHGTIW